MQSFTDVVMLDEDGSKHKGTLEVKGDSIRFEGHMQRLNLGDVRFVSIGRPSRLTFADWVKVEYGEASHPSVVHFREEGAGGAERIYAAMQHLPNSRRFQCLVWARYAGRGWRLQLGTAPRRFWGLATLKKGVIESTSAQTLTLSARGLRKKEAAFSDFKGFRHELLTAKQQLLSMGLTILGLGVGLGLLMCVVALWQASGTEKASPSGLVGWFALGLGLGVVICLFVMLPTLPRVRTGESFSLQTRFGPWEFCVPRQEAQKVVDTLESYGIENQTPFARSRDLRL